MQATRKGPPAPLEYAAGQGHALALWKLGRMYAEGDGVPHDDLKAFEFFSRIADDNTDDGPDTQNSGVVASAFTALGTYFLDGIKGTYVRPNPERAYDMFNYAASYFGDRTPSTISRASTSKGPAWMPTRVRPRAGSTSRPRRAMLRPKPCWATC